MAKKDERPASLKAEHNRKIALWYFDERKTQAWIADQLGIDQSTVSRSLATLKKQAANAALKKTLEWQGDKLLELETARAELWEGWRKSKGEKTTTTTTEYGEDVHITTKVESMIGNPAYLAEVRQAILAEQKILGLDKANDMVIALPLEVLALMQELNLDMSTVKQSLIDEIKKAWEARHITPKTSKRTSKKAT